MTFFHLYYPPCLQILPDRQRQEKRRIATKLSILNVTSGIFIQYKLRSSTWHDDIKVCQNIKYINRFINKIQYGVRIQANNNKRKLQCQDLVGQRQLSDNFIEQRSASFNYLHDDSSQIVSLNGH